MYFVAFQLLLQSLIRRYNFDLVNQILLKTIGNINKNQFKRTTFKRKSSNQRSFAMGMATEWQLDTYSKSVAKAFNKLNELIVIQSRFFLILFFRFACFQSFLVFCS